MRPHPTTSVVRSLLGAAILGLWVRTFVLTLAVVASESMAPTLAVGDLLFLNLLIFKLPTFPGIPSRTPAAGDVVVVDGESGPLIKRCVATDGQRIEARGGRLLVDGVAEPLAAGWTDEFISRAVPPGRLWVLGDNRRDSTDSRHFGAVPRQAVRAQAILRIPRGHLLPRPIVTPARSPNAQKRHP